MSYHNPNPHEVVDAERLYDRAEEALAGCPEDGTEEETYRFVSMR